jgi:hypothetical protein
MSMGLFFPSFPPQAMVGVQLEGTAYTWVGCWNAGVVGPNPVTYELLWLSDYGAPWPNQCLAYAAANGGSPYIAIQGQ